MPVTSGERIRFEDVGVEVVVVRSGEGTVTAERDPSGGLAIGKRYECERTGIVVLVTKPGPAKLLCEGAAMLQQAPKATKSGD